MEKIYFGVEQKEKFYLPGTKKEQWIEVRKLTAAQKAQYLSSVGEMAKVRPDGTVDYDTTRIGEMERKILKLAVCGYRVKVVENGETKLVEGNDEAEWEKLYEVMDPDIGEKLMVVVQKLNPWLTTPSAEDKKK